MRHKMSLLRRGPHYRCNLLGDQVRYLIKVVIWHFYFIWTFVSWKTLAFFIHTAQLTLVYTFCTQWYIVNIHWKKKLETIILKSNSCIQHSNICSTVLQKRRCKIQPFGHILVYSSDTDGYLCMECLQVTIIWHTTLYCTVQYFIFRPTVVNCYCFYTVRKGGVTGECACLTFLYSIDIYEYVCTNYCTIVSYDT